MQKIWLHLITFAGASCDDDRTTGELRDGKFKVQRRPRRASVVPMLYVNAYRMTRIAQLDEAAQTTISIEM